jgi:type I restriction enzyme, S subunit
MITDVEPYSAVKASGVAWLGDVPEHWNVTRMRFLFAEVDRRSQDGMETHLSMSQRLGLVPSSMVEQRALVSESYAGGKLCAPDDLVLNRLKAHLGVFAHASQAGVISPDYTVLRRRRPLSVRYFEKILRSTACRSELRIRAKGIVEGFWRLYTDDLNNIRLPVPPPAEQVAIVRFLDHADLRIRRYIQAKQKLIKLLEEQRQAVIHRAVTRGLDPNVRLQPSGVEWLGDVPEQWQISRVKTEFECLNRHRLPLSATQRGAMTVRRFDYYGASGVIDKVEDYLFDDELLLIAEDGANLVLRNLPLAIIARGRFWVNNHAHILKPKRGNLEYLAAVMERLSYLPWISGAAQPKLTKDRLMSIAIAVAPRLEQDRIISSAAAETDALRIAIERGEQEVTLLREYRTRLIADVVTGKLDVRKAAGRLPDEADDADSFEDEPDAPADAEDAAADDLDGIPEEVMA